MLVGRCGDLPTNCKSLSSATRCALQKTAVDNQFLIRGLTGLIYTMCVSSAKKLECIINCILLSQTCHLFSFFRLHLICVQHVHVWLFYNYYKPWFNYYTAYMYMFSLCLHTVHFNAILFVKVFCQRVCPLINPL